MTDEQIEAILANCKSDKQFPTEHQQIEKRRVKVCPHCGKTVDNNYYWKRYHGDACEKNLRKDENNLTKSEVA
jgi:hypothetical protein